MKTEDQTLNDSPANVGQLLSRSATLWPDHPAVAEPTSSGWRSSTFAELNRESDRIAAGLLSNGVQPGMRLALLVPAGIDFVKFVFALFKAGVVVILIDPGMNRENLIKCLSDARPEGFVGIRKAHLARWLYRKHFPHAKHNFLVGSRFWPGCKSIEKFPDLTLDEPDYSPDDHAAIIFTTGSTGPSKGVLYIHQNFVRQATEIRDFFEIEPGGADISGFPLFALFNTAMGKTTVFPKMDFTRPAEIDPNNIIDAINHWKANQLFGSPALLNTLGQFCEKNQIQLSGISRVLSAGAPVPPHVLNRMKSVISEEGDVHTPYGATEALPVASNSASVVLKETATKTDQGAGTCVGRRFPGIEWQTIRITDEPLETFDQVEVLSKNEIGELIVSGPVVTREYVTRTDANAFHKIQDGNRFWHRMGDVGYLDDQDRFWMCGRKSHRVITTNGTLFTVPCEAIINTHASIYRSALVGIGDENSKTPVMVAEPWPDHWPDDDNAKKELISELEELASKHDTTKSIQHFLLKKQLPTDIRHNSKIFREQLGPWAAEQIG